MKKRQRKRIASSRRKPSVSRPVDDSNDNDPNVQIEILAAELGQSPEVWGRWHSCDPRIDDDLAALGASGYLQVGAFNGGNSIPSFQDTSDERDYWAGWLAREFCGMDEPDDAWDWDSSRPIAGQYQEPVDCVIHPGNVLTTEGCRSADPDADYASGHAENALDDATLDVVDEDKP